MVDRRGLVVRGRGDADSLPDQVGNFGFIEVVIYVQCSPGGDPFLGGRGGAFALPCLCAPDLPQPSLVSQGGIKIKGMRHGELAIAAHCR